MANSLLRAVAPIAIGVCLFSTLSLAAPPRYTWQRVGFLNNSDFSRPLALAEDGTGLLDSDYSGGYLTGKRLTAFGLSGEIAWRLASGHNEGFHASVGSPGGVVAGIQYLPGAQPGIPRRVGAVYTNAGGVELLPRTEANGSTIIDGIDSSGRYVVGSSWGPYPTEGNVIWDRVNGTATPLGSYRPYSVNRNGDSVGAMVTSAGIYAYYTPVIRHRDGTFFTLPLPQNTTSYGIGTQIDDDGRVLVYSELQDARAGLYLVDNNRLDTIVEFQGADHVPWVLDFNLSGQAVGHAVAGEEAYASLWTQGSEYRLTDLIDGWDATFSLTQATAVNDRGQILAVGGVVGDLPGYELINNSPGYFSFLLTPIPEPTSAAVLGLLLATSAMRRGR